MSRQQGVALMDRRPSSERDRHAPGRDNWLCLQRLHHRLPRYSLQARRHKYKLVTVERDQEREQSTVISEKLLQAVAGLIDLVRTLKVGGFSRTLKKSLSFHLF